MTADDTDERGSNQETFLECFSSALLERLARPTKRTTKKRVGRKKTIKPVTQATSEDQNEELSEFIEFLAGEIFPWLPESLQTLSYGLVQNDPDLFEQWSSLTQSQVEEDILPVLPASVSESVGTYSILPPETSLPALLDAAITSYVAAVTAAPPVWAATRTEACEICDRDWIPLTYHHLIPRSTHDRVLKRGWHEEWELNRVAWLCRACHSFVHRLASNEELAKDWHTVDLLMERDDVQSWAQWVGRIRWKAR